MMHGHKNLKSFNSFSLIKWATLYRFGTAATNGHISHGVFDIQKNIGHSFNNNSQGKNNCSDYYVVQNHFVCYQLHMNNPTLTCGLLGKMPATNRIIGRGVKLTTPLSMVPRWRMSGVIPLLSYSPSWCAQEQVIYFLSSLVLHDRRTHTVNVLFLRRLVKGTNLEKFLGWRVCCTWILSFGFCSWKSSSSLHVCPVSFTFAIAYILIRFLSTSLSKYSLAATLTHSVSPETSIRLNVRT